MNIHEEIAEMGRKGEAAARELAKLSSKKKNTILEAMASGIEAGADGIRAANRGDLEAGKAAGLSAAMLDRLELTPARIEGMAMGLRNVIALQDPVGGEISSWIRPNGLNIRKVRVPIGVIGIIFESRPNVAAEAAALCFKTANALILRGGKEAINSNRAIVDAMQNAGAGRGLPDDSIQLVQTTDRAAVRELVQLGEYMDLIVPRGGEGLISAVTEMAHVPVIKHYKGVCHTYVDSSADLEMAIGIAVNAKCQRPGVCNAMETLLVHADIADEFLPKLKKQLDAENVELRGDARAQTILPGISSATEDDWYAEYLDTILAIRVVDAVGDAVTHINSYGSHHSDAIVAGDEKVQKCFLREVDSATVYLNASTRFTDGGEFGLGAEIGISTDKLHARGPMGLEELTTYKYVIGGCGQIRE